MSDDGGTDDFPFPVVACHSDERGDGLAASRSLAKGDLVLRTTPVVAVPKDNCLLTVCGCCFRRAAAEIPLHACAGCKSVAHCSRCQDSGLAGRRHGRDECSAVAMLMQMHAASKQEAQSSSQAGPGGKGGSKGIRHTSQDIAGPPVPADEGTSTLRLVLALGCFVARQRQRQLRSKQRAKRRRASLTAAGRAAAADTVGGSSSGDDEEEEEQGGSEAGWYAGQDVVQDSAEDVEQLHGEPEDLAPGDLQRFMPACAVLKAVQPASARASLEAWLRWATKVHMNEHDINRPSGGMHNTAQASEAGAAAQAHPGGDSTQRGSKRGSRAGRQGQPQSAGSAGRGSAGQAAQASAAALHRPGMEAVGEGLFPFAARFNHSCAPNIRHSVDEWGCLETYVCAEEGVPQGQELLAAYVNPDAPREQRRAHLRERYGFDCMCTRCMAGL